MQTQSRLFIFILACLFLAALPLPAAEAVTGKVDAVTVYSDRALVKRTTRLKPGATRLTFMDLPRRVVVKSIRAAGKGTTITGVGVRTVPADNDRLENHPLKKEIRELEEKIAAQSSRRNNASRLLGTLNNMAQLATRESDRDMRSGDINTRRWGQALDFIDRRRGEYDETIRAADRTINRLNRDLRKVRIRFNKLVSAGSKAGIAVDVTCTKASSNAVVTLTYLVTGVAWQSQYDLRGTSGGGSFKIISQATIRQASGENWDNAKITLSTARPAVGTTPGILEPWRVSVGGFGDRNRADAKVMKEEAFSGSDSREGSSVDTSDTASMTVALDAG